MFEKQMKLWLFGMFLLISSPSFSQMQACPVNINFSAGYLNHWWAYTGNNQGGNGPNAIKMNYDSTKPAPNGTQNVRTIYEYNLPSVPGIQVETTQGTDLFGSFPIIPTINGYQYSYSILLGSTSITRSQQGARASPGGYIRGISYRIAVPAGPASEPYTMTYAYAMVLENGAHNSNQQPLFSATLKTNAGIVTCASPSYYLPTLDNATAGGGGATLDSAAAILNGFSVSPHLSPNSNPNGVTGTVVHLQDVWTKGWNEVTFDLSPYRGQQVVLTFEADNCVPGGHFAYAYVALRNVCAGLIISGDTLACTNSNLTYSVPALTGASYQWKIPAGWTLISGGNSNIITVKAGNNAGSIIAGEQNSCANLKDTVQVKTTAPSIGGSVSADAEVCAGINSSLLTLSGNMGAVTNWVSSQDGQVWIPIVNTGNTYTAQNLNASTIYKAVVQNGTVCNPDTSSGATIKVDPKSAGGTITPVNNNFCAGQDVGGILSLVGNTGNVVNWQSSQDSSNWTNFNPVDNDSSFTISSALPVSTQYRLIVKNGVCPTDTSEVAYVRLFPTPFPEASIDPADTTICYGGSAQLTAQVSIGSSYSWSNFNSSQNPAGGNIGSTPFPIIAPVSPSQTNSYLLHIQNAGCPNPLIDTFRVQVIPPIIVNAGNDTSVVINQPLQLQAISSDGNSDSFVWGPEIGLNNPDIANPIAILDQGTDSITYTVRATDSIGCFGEAKITVRVFKTLPDIFVPNAFTPGLNNNNIFRPIPVGISSIRYFRVYNRWGQLVYSTSRMGDGWDGNFNGKPQGTGSFVWMVEGTSYLGKTIFRKGTMTLVR